MLPWLSQPVTLHSSRSHECKLNMTELCDFQTSYWLFWYEADHRYALPAICFFLLVTGVFTLGYLWSRLTSSEVQRSAIPRIVTSVLRWNTYYGFRINHWNWNSAPVGVLFIASVSVVFFSSMVLGPRPYFWPNTEHVHFGGSPPLATRSGWLALGCLPFVFAASSKASLISAVTGVTYEKLQVFHRWISYAIFILALCHMFPFISYHIVKGDLLEEFNASIAWWSGIVMILLLTWLTFASATPLRAWCYEFFKFAHVCAALLFFIILFLHCDFRLSSWDYFIATACIYLPCRVYASLRTYVKFGVLSGTVSIEENGWIHLKVPADRFYWYVGQHCYVRFLGFGVHDLTSHPFSICSIDSGHDSRLDFYIRAQSGLTAQLARLPQEDRDCPVRVLLDGPYGGPDIRRLANLQHVIMISGGSGSPWTLPLIEDCMRLSSTHKQRTLSVILVARDTHTIEWFQRKVEEVLDKCQRVDKLFSCNVAVEAYIVGRNRVDATSSDNVDIDADQSGLDLELLGKDGMMEPTEGSLIHTQLHVGRPNLRQIVHREAATHLHREVGFFVCGPGGMQHDVRQAVAAEQWNVLRGRRTAGVYLHLEHFSWA